MGDERVDIEAIARREGAVAHRLALVIDPVEDHVVQRPVHELNERSVHVVDRAEQRLSLAGSVFHSSFLLPPPPPCRATSSPPTLVSPRQRLKTEKSERRDGVNRPPTISSSDKSIFLDSRRGRDFFFLNIYYSIPARGSRRGRRIGTRVRLFPRSFEVFNSR